MEGGLKILIQFKGISVKRLRHEARTALITLLALVMIVAAYPLPALAAVGATAPCVAHFTVKAGDTTSKIAHTYHLAWWEIAKANDRKPSIPIKTGETLCIPPKGWANQVVIGTMTASATGKNLMVTISDVPYRYAWYVKVNDSQKKIGGTSKIGQMLVPANTKVTKIFELPPALWKAPHLYVCAKNATTDDKICQGIAHTI
jgi:LysM repeat protein